MEVIAILDFCALSENDISFINNRGSQRTLLHHIEYGGPSVLIRPTEFCNQALTLGLIPLFIDTPNILTTSLVGVQLNACKLSDKKLMI